MSDDPRLGATCDEGGEAPCFAHLLDDEAGDDEADERDEQSERDDAAVRTPAGRPSGPRPG